MQYTREKHLKSESFTKFNKTYELVCAEIVIKDNTHYGEFDYDILANEWDYLPLTEYGVAVWETEPENAIQPDKDLSDKINEMYRVEIICKDEEDQESIYSEMIKRGIECRVLTL